MSMSEIARALERHSDGNRAIAARVVAELALIVNDCSDGWAHWPAPVRAAERLMRIAQNDCEDSDASLRQGLLTVSHFCKRRNISNPADRFLIAMSPKKAERAATETRQMALL